MTTRRTNVVQGVGDREVRKGSNGKVVELHLIPNEHSNGLFVVYLPAEKSLWTADITVVNPTPVQLGVVKSAVEVINRLKLDFNAWIPAHPPNPDKPLTRADVLAAAGSGADTCYVLRAGCHVRACDVLRAACRATCDVPRATCHVRRATCARAKRTGERRGVPHLARRFWHVARRTWHVARSTSHVPHVAP